MGAWWSRHNSAWDDDLEDKNSNDNDSNSNSNNNDNDNNNNDDNDDDDDDNDNDNDTDTVTDTTDNTDNTDNNDNNDNDDDDDDNNNSSYPYGYSCTFLVCRLGMGHMHNPSRFCERNALPSATRILKTLLMGCDYLTASNVPKPG